MKELTKRQEEVLDYIVSHFRDHLCPPTIREIGEGIGIGSTNGVNDHLRALERKGWIERIPKSRGIVQTPKTCRKYNLYLKGPPEDIGVDGSPSQMAHVLEDILNIVNNFPDSVDLSTSTGAVQGASTVIRVIRAAVLAKGKHV